MLTIQLNLTAAVIVAAVLITGWAGVDNRLALADGAGQPAATTNPDDAPIKLSDICQIKLDDTGLLVMSSAKTGQRAILNEKMRIEGFRGLVNVRITPLSVQLVDQTGADMSRATWMQAILCTPMMGNIQRQTHEPGQPQVQVVLVQAYQQMPAMGGNLALPPGHVQLYCKDGDHPEIMVRADSLRRLRLEQSDAVDKYLRPVLRDMQLENVLIPSDAAAMRVLDEVAAPADLDAAVKKLVDQLDAEDFKQREDADRQLRSLGFAVVKQLKALDKDKLTPEQRTRVEAIINRPQPEDLSPELAQHLHVSVNFLLDCLFSDDAGIRTAALAQLEKVVGKKVEFDPNGSADQRGQAIAALRESLTKEQKP